MWFNSCVIFLCLWRLYLPWKEWSRPYNIWISYWDKVLDTILTDITSPDVILTSLTKYVMVKSKSGSTTEHWDEYIDGLVQDCSNSNELVQICFLERGMLLKKTSILSLPHYKPICKYSCNFHNRIRHSKCKMLLWYLWTNLGYCILPTPANI